MDPNKHIIPVVTEQTPAPVVDLSAIPKTLLVEQNPSSEESIDMNAKTTQVNFAGVTSSIAIPGNPASDILKTLPADSALNGTATNDKTNRVAIVHCGGTGVNWGYALAQKLEQVDKACLANITQYYLDTSDSNFPNRVLPENTTIIGGGEGSGGNRKINASPVVAAMPSIVDALRDYKFVIVMGSMSGGSGSVIMPVLNTELKKRKIPMVAVCGSSLMSTTTIENTRKTLESFEGTSQSSRIPTPIVPLCNEKIGSEAQVDVAAISSALLFAMLFSNNNGRMDNNDIRSFLNYTEQTSAPARCVTMFIDDEKCSVLKESQLRPISVLTLAADPEAAKLPFKIAYQSVGFFPAQAPEKKTLHFIIVDGGVTIIHQELKAAEEAFNNEERANAWAPSITAPGNSDSEFGDLVL